MELASPTTDLAQAAADLDRTGIAIVPDAISSETIAETLAQLSRVAAHERERGIALLEDGAAADGNYSPGPNQRVLGLLEKGSVFVDLAGHDVPLAVTRQIFGDSYGYPETVVDDLQLDELRLSSATANIAAQGGVPMTLHADQGFVPATDYPIVVNALWPLVDVDASNGATEAIPGSHRSSAISMVTAPPVPTPIAASAGSVVLLDGRTWHRTGANTTGTPRPVVLIAYCRPWVRPFDDAIATARAGLPTVRPWFVYDQPASQ